MNNNNIQSNDNIPELQSPFEQLREVDAESKEWWNSRMLARVTGAMAQLFDVGVPAFLSI